MMGASRASYAALRARLDERASHAGLEALSADLFAVADLLGASPHLRSALADSGQPVTVRTATVAALLGSRVGPQAAEVISDVAAQRWSSPADMVEVVEGLAAQATFLDAQASEQLDAVEDDLFGFDRAVADSASLQMALTDPSIGAPAKATLVNELLAGRTTDQARTVLANVMSHLRGRRVDAVLEALMALAAEQRNRSVAEVRVARPLAQDQATRLAAVLSRVHGRQVRLNVVLDPSVIGGVSVRLGGEVVDATVATRLQQARRALAG